MNGQHTFDCSIRSSTRPTPPSPDDRPSCTGGQLYSTKVTPGHAVRLRLINHSSYMSFWFSIDNHTLTIVEIDGVEVEPIAGGRGVHVNIGQRYSVVVRADQALGNYYMRATLPQTCFLGHGPHSSSGLESIGYEARGVLSYEGADPLAEPVGVAGNTSSPYGAETNGIRSDVWEGCTDMPFDLPVSVRRQAAVEVGKDNMHSLAFPFQQAGDVDRIFINRVRFSVRLVTSPQDLLTCAPDIRHTRRPTTKMRSSGKPWTKMPRRGEAGTTITWGSD